MDVSSFVQRLNRTYAPVYVILFLSLFYLTFLSSSIHDGIFFAGDQGLKCLQVKQISAGFGFKYLHLGQPEWVQSAWQAGYAPMRPPFFFPSPQGYIIVYPPAFQVISAVLYSWFGMPGLYIIPMLCTLLLLLWMIFLLRRLGVEPVMIAGALFILVFCSPLALYGVMFWEHLPAVFLLFAGLSFIVSPPRASWVAAVLGVVSGLAVWLRPEALMMNFLYGLAVVVLWLRGRQGLREGQAPQVGFLVGLALAVIPFFIFNRMEYGSILGIHGQQLLATNIDSHYEDTHIGLKHGLVNLKENNTISTRYFLFVLLLLPVIYWLVKKRELRSDLRPALLTGIVVLFSLVTPFFLPNNGVVQWGARYFLPIIPVTLVALFLVAKEWDLLGSRSGGSGLAGDGSGGIGWWVSRKIPVWLLILVVAVTLRTFYLNTYRGGYKQLRWRYNERLTPVYNLLKKNPGTVVITSDTWALNDFGNLFNNNYFFVASGNDSLRRLLPLLKQNGVHRYFYIFDPHVPSLPSMLRDSTTDIWWEKKAAGLYVKQDYAAKLCTVE